MIYQADTIGYIYKLFSQLSVVKNLNQKGADLNCKNLAADISEFCRSIPASPQKLLRVKFEVILIPLKIHNDAEFQAAFAIRNLKWSTIRSLQERCELELAGNYRLKPTASANILRDKRQSFAGEFLLESDIILDSNLVRIRCAASLKVRRPLESFARRLNRLSVGFQ